MQFQNRVTKSGKIWSRAIIIRLIYTITKIYYDDIRLFTSVIFNAN